MSIQVIKPGLLATVQDLGRFGSQKYGVIVGGAMDATSLRIANMLVGNDEGEAAIEITLYGTSFTFEQDHLIAITGGNLQPAIDDVPVPLWRPILVKKGSTLEFKTAISGCRAYLAIAGGISVPKKLGSKSTYIRAKIGGFKGRALQKDDVLPIGSFNEMNELMTGKLSADHTHPAWHANYSSFFSFRRTEKIRVIKGSEFDDFDKNSQQSFTSQPYTLTTHADRMGFKFEGPALMRSDSAELLSEGVTYGTIQVPANGQPIILMADRQTTGGYPKIGQVITADLPKLAQLQPANQVLFEIISIEQAEKELLGLEDKMKELSLGIYLKARNGGMSQ